MIGLFLLKMKKLLILVVIGGFALMKRFFGRGSKASAIEETDAGEDSWSADDGEDDSDQDDPEAGLDEDEPDDDERSS